MDFSYIPPPDRDDRKATRAIVPLHRRVFAFVADAKIILALCASTVAAHAWLRGLITRTELDIAVKAEVAQQLKEALADVRGDLAIVKMNTGGLPEWRAKTSEQVLKLDEKASAAVRDAAKANDRIDTYLINARKR